jgi:hypothetical protein
VVGGSVELRLAQDCQDYGEILQLGGSINVRTGAYCAVMLYGFHRKLQLMF